MKIKKTLTTREVEFSVDELNKFYAALPEPILSGLVIWLRENFGLDLAYVSKKKDVGVRQET